MTLQEANDLYSLAQLGCGMNLCSDGTFAVEVGVISMDAGWVSLGKGQGATRDDAFLAAMEGYAARPEVRAASLP